MKTGIKITLGAFAGLFLVTVVATMRSAQPVAAPSAEQPVAPPASETRSYPAMDEDDKHAIFDAHALVEAQLRDPDSAVFDDQRSWLQEPNVVVRRLAGKPVIVCGWVNAKNGYGGMTGDQVYIADLRNSAVVIDATSEQLSASCPS